MSGTISPATGRRYGVERVCSAWDFARSTYYAHTPARLPVCPQPNGVGQFYLAASGSVLRVR